MILKILGLLDNLPALSQVYGFRRKMAADSIIFISKLFPENCSKISISEQFSYFEKVLIITSNLFTNQNQRPHKNFLEAVHTVENY
jgi:hypothetical protein